MKNLAIHSVPRSGSTWLGNIFNSHPKVSFKYQPLFSYAFKDYLNERSTSAEVARFFEKIAASDDAFINQKEGIAKGIIPAFKKEEQPVYSCYKEVRYHHLLPMLLGKDESLKVILLVRNPLAVLQSWYKAPKEFDPNWDFENEWLDAPKKNLGRPEEFNGYNKWKEATLLFLELAAKYPNRVRLVRYSDLLKQTQNEINKLFEFCDLDLTHQTNSFLEASVSYNDDNAYSVYKQKYQDDSWKLLPTPIINQVKKDLKDTKLEPFLDE